MRLLLVGAFPYPHHQGSQVYLQEQAIALRAAGAEVDLLTYPVAAPIGDDPERWRALDGFRHLTPPAWTARVPLRSGPSRGKPLADLGLAMTLRHAVASSSAGDDAYDAILTHHVEATLAAVHGLPRRARPPIVYCVHTLLERELPAYYGLGADGPGRPQEPGIQEDPGHSRRSGASRALAWAGARLDAWAARRADAWIALTQSAERVMRERGAALGACIPPGLPDPGLAHDADDATFVLARHGLTRDGFLLYSGNLDAYQELGCLGRAVGERERRGGGRLPVVVASHDAGVLRAGALPPGLRALPVASGREMRALLRGARASLVMRRAPGGYPIKLVNSLAVGTPPITFLGAEWGLTSEQDALVADPARPVETLARAIERLEDDPALAARLGRGARTLYERRHRPDRMAARTLELIAALPRART